MSAPYHFADPHRLIAEAITGLGFSAAIGGGVSWTVGGLNVWGILATVLIGGANIAWAVWKYHDEKRERLRLEKVTAAEREQNARTREENAYLRARLGFISGEIPAVDLKEARGDYHSKITKALLPGDGE